MPKILGSMLSRRSKSAATPEDTASIDSAAAKLKDSLESLVTQVSSSVQEQLDVVRAAVDKHLADVAASVASPDHSESIASVIKQFSSAAAEQVEAGASRGRAEAQAAAQAEIAAAQAAAQKQVAAESAARTALQQSLDEVRTQLEQARLQVDALEKKTTAFEAARGELESRLAQTEGAKKELADARTKAEGEVKAARSELNTAADTLRKTQAKVEEFEKQRAQLQQAREQLAGRLETETRERSALAEAVEAARQAAELSKAEIARRLDEVEAATRFALTMKEERDKIEAEMQRLLSEGDKEGNALAALERLSNGLRAFDQLTDLPDVLEALLVQLSHEFPRAAIFLVRENCLNGWRSVGLDPAVNVTTLAIPLTVVSPLTRAVTDQIPVTQTGDADGGQVGVFGSAIERSIAVPILADTNVIAVAYGEHTQQQKNGEASLRIAEMLGGQVGRCLMGFGMDVSIETEEEDASPVESKRQTVLQEKAQSHGRAPDPDRESPAAYPGPPRAAHRVTMPEGSEIVVDSTPSLLVNLSSTGAQIRSPKAMRPNHVVRILLPRDEGGLPCKGRIVWAVFEMPRPGEPAMYRAGVQFTEVDRTALSAFLLKRETGRSSYTNAAS